MEKLFNFLRFIQEFSQRYNKFPKFLSFYIVTRSPRTNNEDTYSHTEGVFLAHALAALLAFPEGVPPGGWRSTAKKLIETYLRLRRILKQSAKETRK